MTYEITDERKWRISKSGYSIKTGRGETERIVCSYPEPYRADPNYARFQQWMEDAEAICEAHNAALAGECAERSEA